jgi:hypothetical protein
MSHQKPEQPVLIPVLSEELTTQTFLVPTDFADRLELHAIRLVDAMEGDERFNRSNQTMQVMSFIIQTAVGKYLDEQSDDDIRPPQIV